MEGNREVKSDVFSMLMEDPRYALEVYNALNHSDYQDPGLVEICTMEKGISLTVRNDASFFLALNLNIYEHQSTVCPNMPLRELIYVTNILERYMKNQELMERCSVLREYMVFVDYIRQYQREYKDLDLRRITERAIDRCIEENVLREFLAARRGEVLKVTQLDFTFERRLELEREESWEDGWLKGQEKERVNTERERQAKEREKKRAEQAEEQIRTLQEQLERYQKK